jgi:hypothetical protein
VFKDEIAAPLDVTGTAMSRESGSDLELVACREALFAEHMYWNLDSRDSAYFVVRDVERFDP